MVLWRMLMLSAATMHFAIAWSLWLLLSPLAGSPGLVLLRRVFPDETWPILFGLCGVLAIAGMWSLRAARMHFGLAAGLMLLWGIATLALWPERGPQPGGFLLIHVGFLKLAIRHYAERLRRTRVAVERLGAQVETAETELHRGTD